MVNITSVRVVLCGSLWCLWGSAEWLTSKCSTLVMNGSQRCEMHNLALFRWVGWAWSVCRVAVAILVKSDSARTFDDLPPTQRCIDSVYI